MKKILILLAAALPAFAAADFDFKQLDKLGANATDSTNITLEGPMLKMASGLMNDDKGSAKNVLSKLKGIYVRTWEYAEEGKYNDSDLDPLRNWLDAQHWTKIVDVKEKKDKEKTAIYVLSLPENKPGGFAIISAEAKDVSVVFVDGPVSMEDLGKLGGNIGIPDMSILNDSKKAGKSGKKDDRDDQ